MSLLREIEYNLKNNVAFPATNDYNDFFRSFFEAILKKNNNKITSLTSYENISINSFKAFQVRFTEK